MGIDTRENFARENCMGKESMSTVMGVCTWVSGLVALSMGRAGVRRATVAVVWDRSFRARDTDVVRALTLMAPPMRVHGRWVSVTVTACPPQLTRENSAAFFS